MTFSELEVGKLFYFGSNSKQKYHKVSLGLYVYDTDTSWDKNNFEDAYWTPPYTQITEASK